MPEPEIARRCPFCGVSIRVRADVCPQCGKTLTPKTDETREVKDSGALTSGSVTTELTADASMSAASTPLNSENAASSPTSTLTPLPASRRPPMQATVGMVHYYGPAPRKVIGEDGRNRVDKFRQISSAMIDEAAYDPSLRFVLVAAVLFVLFLFLLLLSELIT